MLLRSDGKPYVTKGCSQNYDPTNKQHDLFNQWDAESIKLGGSPIYYYEVFIPTGEIDKDYWEARGKIYSNQPVELWALYEPTPAQNYMSAFGIDSMNEVVFELNVKSVLKTLGHMPKIGSRIYTPHLGENWEIVQRNLGEFKMWGVLRLQIISRQFQETVTTQKGRVTEKSPNVRKGI